MGASSRYRSLQYFPYLEAHGVSCAYSPLFDDQYLIHLYDKGHGFFTDYARALCRRISSLLAVKRYDLIVIEKELFPYFPSIIEKILNACGIRYLLDLDDALFHQYDLHNNSLIRFFLGGKISSVMRNANGVIAGNNYLAAYAKSANSRRVYILPSVVDIDKYNIKDAHSTNGILTIGWIGSPSTTKHLLSIAPVLAGYCKKTRAKLMVVGAKDIDLPGVDIEILPWSEREEAEMIRRFDVGIMPLPDTPWERGKCGLKLIQYMACGLPVIAAPVGCNSEIIDNGVDGFLPTSATEWDRCLNLLGSRPDMRERMGACGRKKVEERYSLEVAGERLLKIIRDVTAE